MSACASCGRRLTRGSAFCAACGRPAGRDVGRLDIELDGSDASPDGHDVVLAPARASRRWLAGGLVAVLVAVVATSVASGRGDGSAAGSTTTTSTTAASTPTGEASTTAASTTAPTSGDAAALQQTFLIGTEPLFGEATGLALMVAVGPSSYRVDLDAATVTRVTFGSGVFDLQLTPAGLLFRSDDAPVAQLRRPGSDASTVEPLSDGDHFLGVGPADRAWFVRYRPLAPSVFWYQDGDGPRSEFASPSGDYAVPDGVGGLVLGAPGGVYRWVPGVDAPHRVSTGRLQFAGGGLAMVTECDEVLTCADTLLDVRTGERRPPPVPASGTEAPFTYGGISPDGQVVFVLDGTESGLPTWSAVAPDGTTVDLGRLATDCISVGCSFAPQWSPDGRWVVWSPDQTTVTAWRPGLAAPVRLTLPALPEAEPSGGYRPGRPELSVTVGSLEAVVALGGER